MIFSCENPQKADDKSVIDVTIPHSTVKKGNLETCSPQYLLLIVLVVASLLISLATLVLFLTKYDTHVYETYVATSKGLIAIEHTSESIPIIKKLAAIEHESDRNTPTPAQHTDDNSSRTLENLTIVERGEWLAQPPSEVTFLHKPVPYVIIMHTATDNCLNRTSCSLTLRAIQNFHIKTRGWADIGYNFLVGGNGMVYEGRGWEKQGAHTNGYNSKSIGIALIGNFNAIMPTEKQIFAAKEIIQLGVEKGYIAVDYKLFAARQLQATQSPGLMLYEDVQTWPHSATI